MFLSKNNPEQFGYVTLPPDVASQYYNMKGNPTMTVPESLYYFQAMPIPGTSLTKAGLSRNIQPKPMPRNMENVKFPQYSTSNGGLIENQRVGRQVGAYDAYRDTPWQEWTSGIQYYTPFVGKNIKNVIPPVMVPQMDRMDVWGNSLTNTGYINRDRAKDITELDINYSCKSCEIPSATIGTPVQHISRETRDYGVYAPLPVQMPGQYPPIGEYTSRFLGTNTRSWPPPANPIVENMKRMQGIPTVPIIPEYDDEWARQLRLGFDIERT